MIRNSSLVIKDGFFVETGFIRYIDIFLKLFHCTFALKYRNDEFNRHTKLALRRKANDF